jgi:WD40 repeat protein
MRRVLVSLVLVLVCCSAAMGREWTTRDGTSLGEGKLLDAGDDWAAIQFEGRGMVRVPLAQLSLEDLVFAREAAALARGASPARSGVRPAIPAIHPPAMTAAPPEGAAAVGPPALPADDDPFPKTKPDSTVWQVLPDPPLFQWTAADIERAKAAKLPVAGNSGRIELPSQPSPYAVIASGRNAATWDLWDLRTAKRMGTVRGGDVDYGQAAVSADGKYFASASQQRPRGAVIYSTESGKKLRDVAPGDGGDPALLMFLCGGRLLATDRAGGSASIYDPNSSAVVQLATVGRRSGGELKWASSPGGHYVARVSDEGQRVEFYDARNGAMAGDVLVPSSSDDRFNRIEQLSFSADGKELYAWSQSHSDREGLHLYRWSLESGNLESDIAIAADRRQVERTQVGGLPWGSYGPVAGGWLLNGSSLIDTKAGAKVWSHVRPARSTQFPILRILDETHVLTAGRDRGHFGLHVEELPLKEIAKSREIIAAGGTWQDLSLPKLTAVEPGKAPRNEGFSESKAAYEPGPIVAWPKELADFSQFSLMMTEKTTGNVSNVCFPREAPHLAVALAQLSENETAALPENAPERRLPFRLDVIDFVQEIRTYHWNLASVVSLLGLSPSGDRALVLSTPDGRVDVYDIKAGKHVVGFRPKQLPANQFVASVGSIVDEGNVLLFSPTGELGLWALDPPRMVYSRAVLPQSTPAVSHDGKYVAVATKEGLVVAETLSGDAVATLPIGELQEQTRVASLSFSPDGGKLAVVIVQPMNSARMIVWDVAAKSLAVEFQLPKLLIGRVSWAGADVLLSGLPPQALSETPVALDANEGGMSPEQAYALRQQQAYLLQQNSYGREAMGAARFDLARSEAVWSYLLPSCRLLENGPGSRSWFLQRTQNGAWKLQCIGASTKEEQLVLAEAPTSERAEIRGADVKLNIDVGPMPEFVSRGEQRRADFTKVLEEHFRKALDDQTFVGLQGGPITMNVVLRDQRGEELQRAAINSGMQRGLGALARLAIQNGDDVLWSTEQWHTANIYNVPQPMNSQSGLAYVSAWDRALDWLLANNPPHDLNAAATLRGYAQSRLTPSGMTLSRKWLTGANGAGARTDGETEGGEGEVAAPEVQ